MGFYVASIDPDEYLGDVTIGKYPFATPVPFGLGPLGISVLLERIIALALPDGITPWSFKDIF